MNIAGRLEYFFSSWQKITTNKLVLQAVKGYKIPFAKKPLGCGVSQEPALSTCDQNHCRKQIGKFFKKGAIAKVEPCSDQFLSSFFLIDKPNGERRFIFNLKALNKYVGTNHFKMKEWKTVIRLMSPGCFLASIDLEDAYLLVPVDKDDRKYLRFQFWNQLYEFKVLPFGLSSAPFIFTKILKTIM